MPGHHLVIQPWSSLSLFTDEILVWQLCKFHCPSLRFQERLKWHLLKFAKCHFKSTIRSTPLFSCRESEKRWRYLSLLKAILTEISRKSRIWKCCYTCVPFTLYLSSGFWALSRLLSTLWPQHLISLLDAFLLKIKGPKFGELLHPKDKILQITDLTNLSDASSLKKSCSCKYIRDIPCYHCKLVFDCKPCWPMNFTTKCSYLGYIYMYEATCSWIHKL